MPAVSTRRTRRTLVAAASLAATLAALPAAAGAQTFTFETVGPTGSYATNTYAPFVFTGLAQSVEDPGAYGALGCSVSGTFCLYNGFADQNVNLVRGDAGTFTIDGGYFMSWFGSSSATVTGLLAGGTVFSTTFALTNTATLQDFGGVLVDEVRFRSNGYFLADDITVNARAVVTPEPATLALVAGGLAAVAVARWRRRGA